MKEFCTFPSLVRFRPVRGAQGNGYVVPGSLTAPNLNNSDDRNDLKYLWVVVNPIPPGTIVSQGEHASAANRPPGPPLNFVNPIWNNSSNNNNDTVNQFISIYGYNVNVWNSYYDVSGSYELSDGTENTTDPNNIFE